MTSFQYFKVSLLILVICLYALGFLQFVGLILYSAFRRRVTEWFYCVVAFGIATALAVALLELQ